MFKTIFKTLRVWVFSPMFGSCVPQWHHEWDYNREKIKGEWPDNTIRHCELCGKKQKCLGYTSCLASDGEPFPVWQEKYD